MCVPEANQHGCMCAERMGLFHLFSLSCHISLSPYPPAVCFMLAVRPVHTEGAFEAIMN